MHEHDAIVVGSGCAGGVAAMVLSQKGLRVLVLDAGPEITPEASVDTRQSFTDNATRLWRAFVSGRQSTQSTHSGYWGRNPDLFVDDKEHPYSHPDDQPFLWIRGRHLGGKSQTWGGVTPRWSRYEFETPERDGYGKWPLGYDDLEPYYELVERSYRMFGPSRGLPQFPVGTYDAERDRTPAEVDFAAKLSARWADRQLVMAPGVLFAPSQECPWSPRSSLASTLAVANSTGLVTIRTGIAVRNVIYDRNTGHARGVVAIDASSGDELRFETRMVVLCASTIESVRILLNSTDPPHTDGPGNVSGLLGRGLMDHLSVTQYLHFPSSGSAEIQPAGGPDSFFIPRWVNLDSNDHGFVGGFGVWGGIQRDFEPDDRPGFVSGLLEAIGEMLPNIDNRIELDSSQTDSLGIPSVKLSCKLGDNDHAVRENMKAEVDAIISETGGVPRDVVSSNPVGNFVRRRIRASQPTPGWYIHELGGARMGDSPRDSVLGPYCQVWGVPNLLVTDGAAWPTGGWASPTLTIMAITARACEYAADNL